MSSSLLPLHRLALQSASSSIFRALRSPRLWLGVAATLLGCASTARLAAQTTDVTAPAFFVAVAHHERFIIKLTDPAKIEFARKMMRGEIPTPGWIYGRLAAGDESYNQDFGRKLRWNWHLVSDSIDFPEITAEALQTLPSFIEEDKDYWINNLGACAIDGRIESEGMVFRPGQLTVQSASSRVGAGEAVQITGFVITGSAWKKLLVRASGPALSSLLIDAPLADPAIELREAATGRLIAANDNWSGDAAQADALVAAAAQVGAAPWTRGSRDAALLVPLSPGAYTVITRGVADTSGLCVTEVFQPDEVTATRRVNGSVRSFVSSGDQVQVGGFVISGVEEKDVLIRGLGPALRARGVADALADPVITLYNEKDHQPVATNDNWDELGTLNEEGRSGFANASEAAGAPPLAAGSRDAALLATLEPGTYSVVVRSATATTGIALLEIFELPIASEGK